MRAPARHEEMNKQPDQQSTRRRHEQNSPRRKILRMSDERIGPGAETNTLNEQIEIAKGDRAQSRNRAHDNGQHQQSELFVAQDTAQSAFNALAKGRCRFGLGRRFVHQSDFRTVGPFIVVLLWFRPRCCNRKELIIQGAAPGSSCRAFLLAVDAHAPPAFQPAARACHRSLP